MNTLGAFAFLVQFFFHMISFLVLARFLLQWAKADFYNPLSQSIIKLTNPILSPFRRILPKSKRIDHAAWIVFFAVLTLKVIALGWIKFSGFLPAIVIVIQVLRDALNQILDFFTFAIIIHAILSWVSPGFNPVGQVIGQIIEPVVSPIRRILPDTGGIDFSPIVVILIISFFRILFSV
jgi:YggT family protein